ncbi:MAG UNVERIFIED_CONTAM: hypothetical protein LVR18_29425 [Planctomycetaceae bacterium]|jgi:hypothetical protein
MRIRLLDILCLVYSLPVLADDGLVFVRHTIDGFNPNSSCAVLDVDADGDLDIVAGGSWYEASSVAGGIGCAMWR